MKKTILAFSLLLLFTQFTQAIIITRNINKIIDLSLVNYQLDITGDSAFDFTVSSFANGAIAITGRVGNGNNFYLATGTISGSNNYPIRVKNNTAFNTQTTWKANPIFIQSPALNYTDFAGKGNQYIVGRMNYNTIEWFYFSILINVNVAGTQLNIIKTAWENEPDVPLITGNEGEANVGVKNASGTPSFSVYPQPASTEISIQTNEDLQAYKIVDMSGQLVQENAYFTTKKINVAELPKGIYLLQLLNNSNNTITKRIIIE